VGAFEIAIMVMMADFGVCYGIEGKWAPLRYKIIVTANLGIRGGIGCE